MTVKEIFKDIWSIGNVDVRAERINKLAEQDQELATKIEMLLRYSDRFQSVLEDPLIFLDSSSGNRQAARYSVTSELAKGGMGVIYSAYDSQMRRDVVLKCLQRKHRNNFQAVQRLQRSSYYWAASTSRYRARLRTGRTRRWAALLLHEAGRGQNARPVFS